MKNILFISFLLIFHFSFAQIDKKENNFLEIPLFESSIKENHFMINKQPVDFFKEIINLKLKDTKNNSEGKFSLNDKSKEFFNESVKNYDKSSLNKEGFNNSNLTTNINKEFVNKIIRKKIAQEIKDYASSNDALSYGDRNIELYKNYADIENKLIMSFPLSSEIELQIGKDLTPYLNKVLKTELDKTLQNSLNLLALNF